MRPPRVRVMSFSAMLAPRASGDMQRKESNGRFWTEKINQKILDLNSVGGIPIVTDIRYDEYPKDEVYWAMEELNGILVHA